MEIKREVYFEDDFLKVDLEDADGVLFVHVEYKHFNKSIYKYSKAVWDELKLDALMSGYDRIFAYTTNTKFTENFEKDFHKVGEELGKTLYVLELEFEHGS